VALGGTHRSRLKRNVFTSEACLMRNGAKQHLLPVASTDVVRLAAVWRVIAAYRRGA
jgi:hypothetical protein